MLTDCSKAGGYPAGQSRLEALEPEERQRAGLLQPGDCHGAFTAGVKWEGAEKTEPDSPQTCAAIRQVTVSTLQ